MQSPPGHKTTPALSRREFLHATTGGLALASLAQPSPATPPADATTAASDCVVRLADGAIVSLKRAGDALDTDYVQAGHRLGDVVVRYRRGRGAWETLEMTPETTSAGRDVAASADGRRHVATYRPPNAALELRVEIDVEPPALRWRVALANLADTPLEIGDLARPLPMNGDFRQQPTTAVLKHGLVCGDGSFLFWMRRNSVGPYLTLTPDAHTHLEYWEAQGGYRVFIHSAAAGAWRTPRARGGGSRTRA